MRLLVFRACRATVLARLVVLELIMAGRQLGAGPATTVVYRQTSQHCLTVSLSHWAALLPLVLRLKNSDLTNKTVESRAKPL